MAKFKLEFGPPEDTRKKACQRCGLMDASVSVSQASGDLLCDDHLEIEAQEIFKSLVEE
jgi:hypothetical protein